MKESNLLLSVCKTDAFPFRKSGGNRQRTSLQVSPSRTLRKYLAEVEPKGFEPFTPCLQGRRSTK